MDLGNTLGSELNLAAEEIDTLVLVQRRVNESRLDNTLLALGSAEEGLCHARTSHGHGESSRASTILGLDNFVTTELDTIDEVSVGAQVRVGALGEEGNNGDTRVTSNNGDGLILGVRALDLRNEARRTNDVESGDTEKGLWVVNATGLEDLGADGDGGVDRVGDDENLGLGGRFGNGLCEVTDDAGVRVEEVVAGHAGLAGDTGGDEDNLGTLEGIGEAGGCRVVACDLGLGVDVGDVGGDT